MKPIIFSEKGQKCFDHLYKLAESLSIQVIFNPDCEVGGYNDQTDGLYSIELKTYDDVQNNHDRECRILSKFAHELRHSIHINKGYFEPYYNCFDIEDLKTKEAKLFLISGFYAEQDCDNFARNLLQDYGITLNYNNLYDAHFFLTFFIKWYRVDLYLYCFYRIWWKG